MAIAFNLAPAPKTYYADNVGKPLAGGTMYTYRSLNKTEYKPVFQNINGTLTWPQPVLFDENGQQGPFYWETDTDDMDDTYYIEVYDSAGNVVFTQDDYFPPANSGGGNVTTYIPLKNYLINNLFWRNIGSIGFNVNSVPVPSGTVLAPGAHAGFDTPDISFQKNNNNAQDTISFDLFNLATNPLTGDVTPQYFLKYECGNTPSGETFKFVRFPLMHGVKNFESQQMSAIIYARGNSGTLTLQLRLRQFFGSGGAPSADVLTNISGLQVLDGNWTKYHFTFTVPNNATKTLGTCGDDATYIEIWLPLGAATDLDFTKPAVYLGNINPDLEFDTYDDIDAVINAPRCGDIRQSLNTFSPFGWVPMDDGRIGSPSSNATTRANTDTFFLYSLLWNNFSNVFAGVWTSAGAPTIRGASAVDDFVANKSISLTRTLGRVLQNAGGGANFHFQNFIADSVTDLIVVASTQGYNTGAPVIVSSTGTLPDPLPVLLADGFNLYISVVSATTMRLAITPELAITGTNINLTNAGVGTHSISIPNQKTGTFFGEASHALTINELPQHNHPGSVVFTTDPSKPPGLGVEAIANVNTASQLISVAPQGLNFPHSSIQLTAAVNMFMKL